VDTPAGLSPGAEIGTIVAMRRTLVWLATAALLVACAKGSGGLGDDTGGDDTVDPIDGPPAIDSRPPPDAEIPDAEVPDADLTPRAVTLNQTTSTALAIPNTLVCANSVNNVVQFTRENHFYRAFRLADHGVTGAYTATRLNLAIESADTLAGTQNLTVRLHRVSSGTFPTGQLQQLHTQVFAIADVANTVVPLTFSAPVVAPAGSTLVVQVTSPDYTTAGNFFFPGSNTAGESGPSYVMASACGINSPTAYTQVIDPASSVHLVLTVDGTTWP
jgi:hypothetical protein